MALFGRRKPAADLPAGEPVSVASALVQQVPRGVHPSGLTAGWQGNGYLHPSQYMGVFAGGQLTMLGGATIEAQKRQGVESTSTAWYLPSNVTASLGYAMTMRVGNPMEMQKLLDGNNGGLGPISAKQMRANVTAAQIRQSGLAAVQWAQSLSPNA